MASFTLDISMSLDGFIAGPDADLEQPLGRGGEGLHEWIFGLKSWRESHGMEGGESGPDDEVVSEWRSRAGATIMGRGMFSGGHGPWEKDPKADGWWGDEPPFGHPVFVLTHHPREPLPLQGGTTFNFVTDGPEAALELAQAAAGEKDVALGGGANVTQQYLAAGLLDEVQIHLVPMLLGGGVRLLERISPDRVKLEPTRVIHSPAVAHLRYRVS